MIPIMKVEDYLVYSGFSFGLYCSVFRRYETLSSHMTTRSMGLSQMSFGGRMCTFVSCGAVVDIDLLLRSSDTEEVWQESSDPKLSLFLIFFRTHQLQLFTILKNGLFRFVRLSCHYDTNTMKAEILKIIPRLFRKWYPSVPLPLLHISAHIWLDLQQRHPSICMKPSLLERGQAAGAFLDSSTYPRPAATLLCVQSWGFLPGERERDRRGFFLSAARQQLDPL